MANLRAPAVPWAGVLLILIFLEPAAAQPARPPGPATAQDGNSPSARTVLPLPGGQQPRPSAGQASGPSSATGPSLQTMKLPAGAVLVVCEEIGQALSLIPRAVVLSSEEYQKLLEQI